MTRYSKEDLFKLYRKLPQELKEEMGSEENSDALFDIGKRYGFDDKKCEELVRVSAYVHLGLVKPSDFNKTLEEELGLDENTAKKISDEAYRFVFHSSESVLETLYTPKIESKFTPPKAPIRSIPSAPLPPPQSREDRGSDTYREPVS